MNDTPRESDGCTDTNGKIEAMGLHRPGILFEVGGSEFLTRGARQEDTLPVVRLDDASHDTLDPDSLHEEFETGNASLLSTYDTSTETAVSRMTLATVVDAAADHVANREGEYQDEIRSAVDSAKEALVDE